jgi:uncharacterized protein (TIGR02453 family)
MVQKSTLNFLSSLKKNNNRDWFEKNKEKYLLAKQNIDDLTNALIKSISSFDKKINGLTAKDCVFRIYRDVRFSKNKDPYKTNLGASINAGGKKAVNAGYYIHIQPGESFLAGGIWMPEANELKKIRQEIAYNTKEFQKILNEKKFKKVFKGLDESKEYKLARPPKGYEKDHPAIELLKFNSYIVWTSYKDKDVLSKNFLKKVSEDAKAMKPLIYFLNIALD